MFVLKSKHDKEIELLKSELNGFKEKLKVINLLMKNPEGYAVDLGNVGQGYEAVRVTLGLDKIIHVTKLALPYYYLTNVYVKKVAKGYIITTAYRYKDDCESAIYSFFYNESKDACLRINTSEKLIDTMTKIKIVYE